MDATSKRPMLETKCVGDKFEIFGGTFSRFGYPLSLIITVGHQNLNPLTKIPKLSPTLICHQRFPHDVTNLTKKGFEKMVTHIPVD